jgi:hypothetical protein
MNLPVFEQRTRKISGKGLQIFDPVRGKYVALTPEEWVRQNVLQYLIQVKKTPRSLIRVEMSLEINNTAKRSDLVVHDRNGQPLLAVECKAPEVKITQDVFDQLARYNLKLQVPYLLVSNGVTSLVCRYSPTEQRYAFIDDVPEYDNLHKIC